MLSHQCDHNHIVVIYLLSSFLVLSYIQLLLKGEEVCKIKKTYLKGNREKRRKLHWIKNKMYVCSNKDLTEFLHLKDGIEFS